MFPKLRLKHKPNLISLAGGMAQLPCTDPDMRATPLDPAAWREKMAAAAAVNAAVEAGKAEPVGVLSSVCVCVGGGVAGRKGVEGGGGGLCWTLLLGGKRWLPLLLSTLPRRREKSNQWVSSCVLLTCRGLAAKGGKAFVGGKKTPCDCNPLRQTDSPELDT
jgi:hypothetical protein